MKPEPKTVKVVCTACGLDWDAHGAKPTLAKCVELLRAELTKRPKLYPFTQASASGVTYGQAQNPGPWMQQRIGAIREDIEHATAIDPEAKAS